MPTPSPDKTTTDLTRRKFVATTLAGITAVPFLGFMNGYAAENKDSLTVQQVIDLILAGIPKITFAETVDTLKSGDPAQPVTGIVTTMFATVEVIRKAIDLGANFIIAHEPTFYNHRDDTTWLNDDTVYQYKRDLLTKNNIAIWRFHDYWHTHRPDGVLMGVLSAARWEQYYNPENPSRLTIPPMSLERIIHHLKEKLGIANVKVVGDLSQVCQQIVLMPGASGGRRQIEMLKKEKPDLLICGEIQEWETSEYMRDARAMGAKQSLLVLGHAVSEEPGMRWLVQWLQPKVPAIKVTHVPSQDPFTWV